MNKVFGFFLCFFALLSNSRLAIAKDLYKKCVDDFYQRDVRFHYSTRNGLISTWALQVEEDSLYVRYRSGLYGHYFKSKDCKTKISDDGDKIIQTFDCKKINSAGDYAEPFWTYLKARFEYVRSTQAALYEYEEAGPFGRNGTGRTHATKCIDEAP